MANERQISKQNELPILQEYERVRENDIYKLLNLRVKLIQLDVCTILFNHFFVYGFNKNTVKQMSDFCLRYVLGVSERLANPEVEQGLKMPKYSKIPVLEFSKADVLRVEAELEEKFDPNSVEEMRVALKGIIEGVGEDRYLEKLISDLTKLDASHLNYLTQFLVGVVSEGLNFIVEESNDEP